MILTKPLIRAWILVLLALTLPAQGMASVAGAARNTVRAGAEMPCHAHASTTQATHATHATVSATGTHVEPGTDRESQSQDIAASHLCCHMVLAYFYVSPPAGAVKHPGATRPVRSLATLYIPDSPDRPPRG